MKAVSENHTLADYGILDVTDAPYSADRSGTDDSTRAIRQAIIDARDGRMVAYLPPGLYRVSDTIWASQINQQSKAISSFDLRDDFPCVLWGGSTGGRAKIVLSDASSGFGDPEHPKPVISTETDADPNITFNVMIISIDVDLGARNAGAIGIDHQGAQGSVTEDVRVFAHGAFAGLRGVSGSGGSASHISVYGGRYGLYLAGLGAGSGNSGSQPVPVISHLVLDGQTERSIIAGTRGPLTLVGASIGGPGIQLKGSCNPWDGAVNIVDSVIRDTGDGPVIIGNRPVYLNNVFVEHAATIAHIDHVPALEGLPDGWTHVVEYGATPSPAYPILVNGTKQLDPVIKLRRDVTPPEEVLRTHEWAEELPRWDSAGVANVKQPPYGARGDAITDDTEAIQRAIDENRDVFLPKGIYRISKTLQLKSDSRLFGVGVYSRIEPMPDASAFADSTSPTPMLATPDDREATCVAAFFQLWCRIAGAYAMHWQAGRKSVVRNVRTKPSPWLRKAERADHPMIVIDGNGGGRWYNALMHMMFPQGPNHRHVVARGTRQPLAFYMLNSEHSAADYMVEFDCVQNATVYGMKSETIGAGGPRAMTPVCIRDSSRVRIFGHGGNAVPPEDRPLYRIERCTDFLLTNFSYQYFPTGADPATWYMVEEIMRDGTVVRTPGTENFTVYRRE